MANDHEVDPDENVNIARFPEHEVLVNELSERLQKERTRFRQDPIERPGFR